MSSRAYIGLGSNLGNPPAQVQAALAHLQQTRNVTLVAQSRLYRSAPLGMPGQADYCNAVCAVDTDLAPLDLLDQLQTIETALGRQRGGPRWGARRIDLDLLLYGDLRLSSERLILPHPELRHRNFVLRPLAEIAPDLILPGGDHVTHLAEQLGDSGLSYWPESAA